jgi:hypothetical protein
MNAMECIEYYGMKQGLEACKDWYDDFLECVYQVGASVNEILYRRYRTMLIYNTLEKCLLFFHEKIKLSFKRFKVVKKLSKYQRPFEIFFSKFGIERLGSLIRFQDPDLVTTAL